MSSTRMRLVPLLICGALALGGCNEQQAPPPATPASAPATAPVAQTTPPATPVTPAAAPQAAPIPASAQPEAQPAISDASRNDVDKAPNITDADLPPLPVTPFPAARPMEVVQAVFKFAAKHPEVLSKVPCFCGCERMGHRQNDDCFVSARDARGRPTAWEPHGVG
jgi:uncharacterized protein with PCYCGC motif